jgi:hypothetical protein
MKQEKYEVPIPNIEDAGSILVVGQNIGDRFGFTIYGNEVSMLHI